MVLEKTSLNIKTYKGICQQDQNGAVIILDQGVFLVDQTGKLLKPGKEYEINIGLLHEINQELSEEHIKLEQENLKF